MRDNMAPFKNSVNVVVCEIVGKSLDRSLLMELLNCPNTVKIYQAFIKEGIVTVQDLTEKYGVAVSTAYRIIGKMEAKGLVEVASLRNYNHKPSKAWRLT